MNYNFEIYKFQPVQINVNAGQLEYPIPDQQNLRNAVIQKIEVYTASFIPKSPLFSLPTATTADMQNCMLILNVGTDQDLRNIPSLIFNPVQQSSVPFVNYPAAIQNKIFSWDKCGLFFTAAPSGNVTVVLGVYYDDRQETLKKLGYIDSAGNWTKASGLLRS